MEIDEIKASWLQHEKMLVKNTRMNNDLLIKLLLKNAEKRIDWLKVKSLLGLILPIIAIIFIVIPRIQFTLEADFIIGTVLFVSLSVLTYIWAIKLYLRIERLNPSGPVTAVSKELKSLEKYKLKIRRQGLMLAPLMIIGVFLSAGIPFLSSKMIPFYVLMLISFLIGNYVQAKHGLVAQVRKIDREIEEISKLEMDLEPIN